MSVHDEAVLSAYLAGELPPDEAAALQRRLDADPALRAELDSLRRLVAALGRLPAPEPPPGFWPETLAAVRRAAAPSPRGPALPGWVGNVSLAGAAAALAGAAFFGLDAATPPPPPAPVGDGPFRSEAIGAAVQAGADPARTVGVLVMVALLLTAFAVWSRRRR